MNNSVIQLLVMAGIALFLILRLRSVLGTRDGFEKPRVQNPQSDAQQPVRRNLEVVEGGGVDRDIVDHVPEGSAQAKALMAMKAAEPDFSVSDFLSGARGAYEMILMAFENGDLEEVAPFLSDDVLGSFESAVASRKEQNLSVEAKFIGVRELSLNAAEFDQSTGEAEITVRFVGELTSVVRNEAGDIVAGSPNEFKKQRDVWTFARHMGENDPNWKLVATGE